MQKYFSAVRVNDIVLMPILHTDGTNWVERPPASVQSWANTPGVGPALNRRWKKMTAVGAHACLVGIDLGLPPGLQPLGKGWGFDTVLWIHQYG